MKKNLLSCENCTGYDDGGCPEMQLGHIPEECQLFEPVEVLSRRRDLLNVRGMRIRVGMEVLSPPTNPHGPLNDEELRGNIINIIA